MKKFIVISLFALAALIAFTAGTINAADNNNSNNTICNFTGINYECESWANEQYPLIDLFGEKNVPLFKADQNIWDAHVNKLARLILDSNETYTLKNNEKLDLGNGYSLEAKQIDIDNEKVWLELTKDGKSVADQNISVNTDEENKTWTVTLDNVQGEDNIVVMKVYVKQLFAGVEDNLVRIDGIWLIDYTNARTLNIGDQIGQFTLTEIINGADKSNLRSLVFKYTTNSSLNCSVVGSNYECNSWSSEQYPTISLFEEDYIPLLADSEPIWQSNVNKLSKLILDSNETYTLEACEKIDLGHGYALKVKQIDIDNEKVWLEFTRNGHHVADKKVAVDNENGKTWTVTLDNIQGEDNIVVMKVHVKNLFVGTEKRIVWIDGIWLIDYTNSKTLNIGNQLGKYTLTEIIKGVNESNLGSLIFKKGPLNECSTPSGSEKRMKNFADKGKELPVLWYWDFGRYAIKCK